MHNPALIEEGRNAFDALTGERPMAHHREHFAKACADIAGWPDSGRFAHKGDMK